jgi:glycosyltransferase involved in cell wall biosynthesis
MRILMVQHTPWDRELGAARVQLELAEVMRAAGHTVDHFAFDDAFPNASSGRVAELIRPHFSRYAEKYVRANASRYDVIDALDGSISVTKASLGFDGLLVARSSGLRALYREALRDSTQRFWSDHSRGKPVVVQIRDLRSRRADILSDRSVRRADVVIVLNRDETAFAVDKRGVSPQRVVRLPLGLDEDRRSAFAVHRGNQSAGDPEVAFIGSWDWRKGALEWPRIMRAIHGERPDIRFRLLGTRVPVTQVMADLGYEGDARVVVVPSYQSEELPALLAHSIVGLFPSHVEGFPFAVLEMLAAGLPVVAYDAPGAREMLVPLDRTLLTPVGDPIAIANRTLVLLDDDRERARLAAAAAAFADGLRWSDIAAQTIAVYETRLDAMAPTMSPTQASAQSVRWS